MSKLVSLVLISATLLCSASGNEPFSDSDNKESLLTIQDLMDFNDQLGVTDSWVIGEKVAKVSIVDGKDLVEVETGMVSEGALSKGIWYNPHESSVFLKVGKLKRFFVLPSNSTLAFGVIEGNFPERAVLISGASRDDVEFLDLLEFGKVSIRTEAEWIDALSENVSGKVFDDIMADGATFGPRGVTSLNIGLLKDTLTYDQLEFLLNSLGLGMRYAGRMAADYNDMWCASRASCQEKVRWVCTSNC